MKIYITTWRDDDDAPKPYYRFIGTQADQRKINVEIKGTGARIERSEAIEVATDKAGLIAFLNDFELEPEK